MPFGSELEPLERTIGYKFRDRGLLEHALTHRSRVHEDASGGVFDNESMEFLGDSILGFVIADLLFRQFPQHNEGQKSKLRRRLVSAASLARLGERINLGEYLILGRGEEKTGGRRKHAHHRRLLRGADRRHLPRRRIRTRPRVSPPPVPGPDRRSQPHRRTASRRTTNPRCRSCCSSRAKACPDTASPPKSAPPIAAASRSKSWSAANRSPKPKARARRTQPRTPRSSRWQC